MTDEEQRKYDEDEDESDEEGYEVADDETVVRAFVDGIMKIAMKNKDFKNSPFILEITNMIASKTHANLLWELRTTAEYARKRPIYFD